MNHHEKSELLEAFALGVEKEDFELLRRTLDKYNAMIDISVARQMQRENYHTMKQSDQESVVEILRTINQTLNVYKQERGKRVDIEL